MDYLCNQSLYRNKILQLRDKRANLWPRQARVPSYLKSFSPLHDIREKVKFPVER